MRTRAEHHQHAIAELAAHFDDDEFRLSTDKLRAYMARDHRSASNPRRYIEAYERVHGGVVFLNWWTPTDREGLESFFDALADHARGHVSPRPYQLGQACDGTIGAPVWTAFHAACVSLGCDPTAIYKDAYPKEGPNPIDWTELAKLAEWQGGVALPASWDEDARVGLCQSLHNINAHYLVELFTERTATLMPYMRDTAQMPVLPTARAFAHKKTRGQ
ncbi:hypothetical protein [Oleiharenicola sp. Vm1]|uniref:hypothetical protein n=1 Tax=Oleiharenicola sp. Vm1 TaxID=3398393 RepID=UPI0039F54004